MNRFRRKKEAKEASDGVVRASTDSDAPPPTVKSSKTFRRGKKTQEPESKPEIDLSSALPSSDDFRTSLLMSGLSARFSMLREQDDPKSKIGKASDDSVLFPKRSSRLNDFGFSSQGLSDIAEVSSINGSVRPPFAFGRADSFAGTEGYGTDDDSTHTGSMMNRSKPGEGNNLFGGRQKIMMGNRALYDNDVSQSAFQKIRQQEREQKEKERQEHEDNEAQSSRPSSPPLSGYNRNRETSSTTSSAGPSITRSSTAATSFTSQRTPSLNGSHTPITPTVPSMNNGGLDRSATKTRRLYETGLDNHLHEQQHSAMSRIDTITRQRTLGTNTPPPGLSPTYGVNAPDRWDRKQIAGKMSMPNLRTASPPPTGTPMGTFDFGVQKTNNVEPKLYSMASPPLSPPMSEFDEQGVLPVQPNDRGKATALGAFAKPAPYDEGKYTQRQLQMQQGRETPPLRKNSPPRAFPPRQQQYQMGTRSRAESNATFASDRSRSNSSGQRAFLPYDRIPEAPHNTVTLPETAAPSPGAFLASTDSDPSAAVSPIDLGLESSKFKAHPKPLDLSNLYRPDQRIKLQRPPESQHPANRQRSETSPVIPNPIITSPQPSDTLPPPDSPTLGPETGLSGMVRQHLRSDSNSSSVYGGVPSSIFASRFPVDPHDPMPQNEYVTKNNPWDNDDWDQNYDAESNYGQDDASVNGSSIQPPPLSVQSPSIDSPGTDNEKSNWEKEMDSRHTRDGSSETQKERLEFRNQLASRRRQVQENLKSFHETESRSASPLPPTPADWPKEASQAKSNALGLLKTKSSRGSLVGRPKESGTRAMKMLGIGHTTITTGTPSPNRTKFEDAPWDQEVKEPARPQETTPPNTRSYRDAKRAAQRDKERQMTIRNQQRIGSESDQDWPVQRKDMPRMNQRMDNSWVDNSRMDAPRMDHPRMNSPRTHNRMDGRMDNRMDNPRDHQMDYRMDNRGGNRNDHQMDHRRDNRVDNRWENRMDRQMESPRLDNQYRQQEYNDRGPPRHRTPSRERKPPPVTYSHRNGNGSSSQESKNSSGTNQSGSRPPSNASRDRSGSDTSGGRSKSRNGNYKDDLAKAMAEGTSTSTSQQGYDERDLHPATRLMPRSPGPPGMGLPPSPMPSPRMGSNGPNGSSAPNGRSRSNSRTATGPGYFDGPKLPNIQTGAEPVDVGNLPRPSPSAPFVVNPTPALISPLPLTPGANTPTASGPSPMLGPSMRKKSVNKSDISEPKFLSSTSRVTTVNLPPGSSLQNGASEVNAPPIPPVNPKRRQTRTMFAGFIGRKDEIDEIHSMPAATQSTEEMSTFSGDEDESKRRIRKLRKSSSEGGNLNARARQAANAAPSPAMPGTFPLGAGEPLRTAPGGMF